ncbi:MAG: hypothetical protein PHC64_00655 [Candidatus Gastranaerophilales bacterium]|nr:hypothetical protein [Candidatus Gastranaerophilales bacterium]
MQSVGINQIGTYNTVPTVTKPVGHSVIPPMPPRDKSEITFGNEQLQQPPVPALNLRTQLTTQEEQTMYMQLASALDRETAKNLEILLKSGILLNANSNDGSSTLINLYKMAATPRAKGLDPRVVLTETINTLANPFVITQRFGNIPKAYEAAILQNAKPNPKAPKDVISPETINVERSGACVSASIEFNLAKQMPAEFARFAQELTSPKLAVDKVIHLPKLADKTLDAVWLLNAFEVPYKMGDFNTAILRLAPDANAFVRAQIQTVNKDRGEHSVIDVLMQSTFMNVGSQQTYDSLTDNREGKFNENPKGLIEFEKTFTESVVQDKNKISVTYQTVDENGKLVGYEADAETVKRHLMDSLVRGENVIIGYTQTDDKGIIINGHEITIIGAREDKKGKLIFICNDTDDEKSAPVEYSADELIPMIHHAGLPQEVAEKDMKFVDSWIEGMNAYKAAKNQPQQQTPQPLTLPQPQAKAA